MNDDLISRSALLADLREKGFLPVIVRRAIERAPAIDADTYTKEATMKGGLYTANEVAGIIADLFGDTCACNFNGIDEWLPFKCELLDACPNPCGVACWEQYLKYRHCKNEMKAKEE